MTNYKCTINQEVPPHPALGRNGMQESFLAQTLGNRPYFGYLTLGSAHYCLSLLPPLSLHGGN